MEGCCLETKLVRGGSVQSLCKYTTVYPQSGFDLIMVKRADLKLKLYIYLPSSLRSIHFSVNWSIHQLSKNLSYNSTLPLKKYHSIPNSVC